MPVLELENLMVLRGGNRTNVETHRRHADIGIDDSDGANQS
eukprot:SAG11_NODE_1389_length_5057_cov_16.280355_4_plen_41_part_00